LAQDLFSTVMAARPSETPNLKLAVPFFGIKDIEASLRFYVDGLGFAMTRHWAPEERVRWCWLERDGVAVMLQEYWKDGRQGGAPAGVLGEGVRICFVCADAIAVYHEARARGLQPSLPFVGNSLWVVSLVDPDGYRLDFESPTDIAEGSAYSEPA
jgi:lactoylglutathione lyase